MAEKRPTSREFRDVMGTFPTGVAVVATVHEGGRYGMTINSLTSVSLSPMIVLVSLDTGSITRNMIIARGAFAVSLLGEHQEAVSRRFVSKVADRFDGVALLPRGDDLPVLAGAAGHLVCRVHQWNEIGDHTVIYGEVRECAVGQHPPLAYVRGTYARVTTRPVPREASAEITELEAELALRSTGWG